MKRYEPGTERKNKAPSFVADKDEFLFTELPVAVASWVLESIGFRELVDSSVEWDTAQCGVAPGDAAKAIVLTMSMGPERPAIENVAERFDHEPLNLYFDTIEEKKQLDPDMLARTLTKIHESDERKLFMSTSAAVRTFFGIRTRALRSDTSSVSVHGEYEVYDEDGYAYVIDSEGNKMLSHDALYITRGYSKDKRPDLKQYMLGDVVDDNGIQWLSAVLDGNTADSNWNKECLEIMKDVLQNDRLTYVADSKVVNDPLVTMMLEEGIMFLSRCPASFSDQLLDKTLMAFDLDELKPIEDVSPRKKAAKRRITSTVFEYKGMDLRAVLVETSTLAGKGEKAVEKAEIDFRNAVDAFVKDYNCQPDAQKAFERFQKKHSKGIFDIFAQYNHEVVEKRPRGRPRADGSDIRRFDRWTVEIDYRINPEKAEVLRRRKSYMMLISSVPTPEQDPDVGLTDEDLVRLYCSQWRVEWNFRGKKRPIMVERLFMKDVGRAEALITLVNIAALVRATVQLLMRRSIDSMPDKDFEKINLR